MAGSSEFRSIEEIKDRLRTKAPSELMEEMENLSSTPDYDVDLLCAYLDVLEEKAPVFPEGYSPAEDFECFEARHKELFDSMDEENTLSTPAVPQKNRRHAFRRFPAAIAAALCVFTIAAEAHTPGTIERMVEWGAEVFSLRPASGKMELSIASEDSFFSLQEALDHYGIKGAVIPTWIPKQYSVSKITAVDTGKAIIISGKYIADGDDSLLIRVIIDPKGTYKFEEDLVDGHTWYESNGLAFIISTNFDEQRATWSTNGCTCSVSGNLTEEELKGVLNSIQ